MMEKCIAKNMGKGLALGPHPSIRLQALFMAVVLLGAQIASAIHMISVPHIGDLTDAPLCCHHYPAPSESSSNSALPTSQGGQQIVNAKENSQTTSACPVLGYGRNFHQADPPPTEFCYFESTKQNLGTGFHFVDSISQVIHSAPKTSPPHPLTHTRAIHCRTTLTS